jgi:ABC-type lipoprotein release transport system permease subunit
MTTVALRGILGRKLRTALTTFAIVAGTLAAILPARRAGRLNVLEALQCE